MLLFHTHTHTHTKYSTFYRSNDQSFTIMFTCFEELQCLKSSSGCTVDL